MHTLPEQADPLLPTAPPTLVGFTLSPTRAISGFPRGNWVGKGREGGGGGEPASGKDPGVGSTFVIPAQAEAPEGWHLSRPDHIILKFGHGSGDCTAGGAPTKEFQMSGLLLVMLANTSDPFCRSLIPNPLHRFHPQERGRVW